MITERDQRDGADFDVLRAEQEGTLCVTYGAAAGLAGLQECLERSDGGTLAVDLPQKRPIGIVVRISFKQHENRSVCALNIVRNCSSRMAITATRSPALISSMASA